LPALKEVGDVFTCVYLCVCLSLCKITLNVDDSSGFLDLDLDPEKFYAGVLCSLWNNQLDNGGDPDHNMDQRIFYGIFIYFCDSYGQQQ